MAPCVMLRCTMLCYVKGWVPQNSWGDIKAEGVDKKLWGLIPLRNYAFRHFIGTKGELSTKTNITGI